MTFGEVSGRGPNWHPDASQRNVGLGVGQFGEGEGRLKFLSGPARRLTAREVVPPVISHNGSRSRNGGGSVCGTGHAGIPSALSVYLTLAVLFGSVLATRRQLSGSSSSLSATRGRLRLESSFHCLRSSGWPVRAPTTISANRRIYEEFPFSSLERL